MQFGCKMYDSLTWWKWVQYCHWWW